MRDWDETATLAAIPPVEYHTPHRHSRKPFFPRTWYDAAWAAITFSALSFMALLWIAGWILLGKPVP